MDNSNNSTFITNKYAIIFEGEDSIGNTLTYSVKLYIDFAEFKPVWDVDRVKAYPLFYARHIAESFIDTLKTSKESHIKDFRKTWKMNLDSLRILELGYNDEFDFEKVWLND